MKTKLQLLSEPPNGKYVSSLEVVTSKRGPLAFRPGKRRATLSELARLIREAHAPALEFADHAQFAASFAIRCAVACGGYLRAAKAAQDSLGHLVLRHGEFLPWVKRATGIQPRTATNYMRLHTWVCTHRTEILAAKPYSLRQFYILAGILPEDGSKTLPKTKDDLAKLRRAVRKVTAEAAAHRDFADSDRLWRALEPLAALLREVSTDTSRWKKTEFTDFDCGSWRPKSPERPSA